MIQFTIAHTSINLIRKIRVMKKARYPLSVYLP